MTKYSFARTWWGEKWMDALKGVYYSNRIGRGRTYANTGRVYDIIINDNLVLAKVKGNYRNYYSVSVEFKQFTQKEKNIIIKTIYDNPSILSALLNHKVPAELYEMLLKAGVNVFPKNSGDLTTSCNCPDWAEICKHIAGLVHMIALEIDKNPFLIFKLQGLDLLDRLDYESSNEEVKDITDLFNSDCETADGEIDFSTIPILDNEIFTLLEDKPVFYKKDFKKILNTTYKSISRYVKKNINSYTHYDRENYHHYYKLDYNEGSFEGDEDDFDDWLEEVFLKKWIMPNLWENFSININNNYNISKIDTNTKNPFKKDKSEDILFGFFMELSQNNISMFNDNIAFLYSVFEFTIELIKNHAIIPELFKTSKTYRIRWIPAVFDNNIMSIISRLANNCPSDLITFKNKKISPYNQIICAVSLFIRGFLNRYLKYGASKSLMTNYDEDVFRLFFFEGQKFKGKLTTAQSVNQWLSKFTITDRDYDLYLVVDNDDDKFNIDVKVNAGLDSIADVINTTENKNLKTNLLKDIYLINDIFPKFNNLIDLKENLEFNLNEFSNFFKNTLPLFEMMGLKIVLPKTLNKIFRPKLKLEISSAQNEEKYLRFKDLKKFDWKIAIGNTTCTIEEFKELTEKSKGLVKIANEYVMLDEKEVKSLIKQINKLPQKLNQHELMKAILSGEIRDADVSIDKNIGKLVDNILKQEPVNVPSNVKANLRPYQKKGYSWLVQNINSNFGSILADDMGLGKTLQVLTTIQHFKNEGLLENEKVLVIAPTSLLTNWQEEIIKFTPDLSSYIFHGKGRRFTKKKYDIYLTSFGVIRRDSEKFKRQKWFLTIIDEAQNIKNPNTKQTKAVKSIKAKHKIAMSGTPVENRLSEYWSIFDYTNKGYLSTLKKFRANYIVPIEKERNSNVADNFRKITQPFILRRSKSDKDIINDLPDKIVSDVYCNLTANQVALYKETLDAAMLEVNNNEGIKRKGIVLKLINSLKQICNHPAQFTKIEDYEINQSGKLEVLMNLVKNILDMNEKVLIFTQYVKMGEIIKEFVEDKFSTEALFLHGSLSRKKRDNMVKKFQNNKQNKIFIISLKAGGTGLNLTAAQNVIHYDLWWNPAVENQATDRAYRIGQNENVMVYRFITKGTFEEKINKMIKRKEELADLTVGNGEAFITEMSSEELKEMLSLRK